MALRLSGFTRASSLGPIADFMNQQGGSIARVLTDVDLPFALLETPDLVVPLREQFRLLETAARETGDPYFGASLGQVVRSKDLSAFGAWVCAAETLADAIGRADAGLNTMLQTSTLLKLSRQGPTARWSIEFVEPETQGRHHNEFLGLSYMIDVVRHYAGPRWRPEVICTALARGSPRGTLEGLFRANISHGHAVPAIEFDLSLLGNKPFDRPWSPQDVVPGSEPPVPGQDDTLATIAAVVELALHQGYPRIDWVASKLGTTRRSLQRRICAHGTSFHRLVEVVLMRQAKTLLAQSTIPITDIAFGLGYSDAAHFTRAFRRAAGTTPSHYRQTRT